MKKYIFLNTALIFLLYFINFKLVAQPGQSKRKQSISDYLDRAYLLQQEKKYDDAIIEYNRALQIEPSNHMAYYNMVLIYANTNNCQRAIAIAEKGLENCKEDHAAFYRLKANCLAEMKRYAEALPVYHKALILEPDNANLQYNLGYAYFMLKQWESAIIYLNSYIEQKDDEAGSYTDALFYIGTSYNGIKKYKEAITYLDRAIERSNYHSYYYNKAEALSNMDNNQAALLVLNEAIALHPKIAMLYHKRYQVYKSLNQNEKASNDLKKAEQLDPNDGDILLDIGVGYENDNQMQQAISYFRKCITLKQSVSGAYGNIANIYSSNELMLDSAVYYYQQAIFVEPDAAQHYYNFGNYFKKTNQLDQAINLYLKAIALDSSLSQPYNNLAIVYSDKKEVDKAINYLVLANRKVPNNFSTLALLASFYFEKSSYANVIQYATKALIISPKGTKQSDLLYKRGVSRQILGEYKNALYDYLEVVDGYNDKDKKENAGVISNIGYCYFEDDQFSNALKYFGEAVNYNPEIDQLIGLFTVQYLQGKTADYKMTLNQAITLEPKLAEGYQGITKLEADGYFYTEKHKIVLRKILSK
jgi:tetratricopeptide (TPR) repeat protein